MNRRIFFVLVSLAGLAAAALLSCARTTDSGIGVDKISSPEGGESAAADAPPPLVIDEDAPLLLDEPAESEKHSPASTTRALKDNIACFVCHANYREEALASQHAVKNVGCVDCHGPSYAHRNDENNITPPDRMYPADKIDQACRKCHTTHDVPAAKVIACWQQRYADKTTAETIVCTDCHGDHRLKLRTVRWDKKTGKLL
jgi:hypothetical protein